MTDFIKTFKQLNKTDVHIAGGKGASLGEMTNSKISVPPGFVITAQAFEQFLAETDLEQEIEAQLDKVNYEEVDSILYCLFEKKLSTDETQKLTGIEISTIEKIQELNKNSEHKRLPAQKPDSE